MLGNRKFLYDGLTKMFKDLAIKPEVEHENFNSLYEFKPYKILITSNMIALCDYETLNNRFTWMNIQSIDEIKGCLQTLRDHLIDYKQAEFVSFYNSQFE